MAASAAVSIVVVAAAASSSASTGANLEDTTTFNVRPFADGAHANDVATRSGAGVFVPGAGGKCDPHTRETFAVAGFSEPSVVLACEA